MPLQKTAPTTDDDLLRLRVDGWCLLEGVIPETQVGGCARERPRNRVIPRVP